MKTKSENKEECHAIYIVRLTPKNKRQPPEEYYYWDEDNARYHYNLFSPDEAEELYERIELIRVVDVDPVYPYGVQR